MDLRHHLTDLIAGFEKLRHPAILERFVLRNGKQMKPCRRIGRQRTARECFKNATEFVAEHFATDYVEGLAYRPGLFPLHHAWVNVDGRAMDPTWDRPGTCSYFGVTFTPGEVAGEMVRTGLYGVLDTPTGLNLQFIFEKDPELKPIVEAIVGKELNVRRAA